MRRGRAKNAERAAEVLAQRPYAQVTNRFSPMEVLREDQIERIHDASMQILETTGMEIMYAGARQLLRKAGFDVDDAAQRVRFDRHGIAEAVAQAPSQTSVRGRDAAKRIAIGDGNMIFAAVGGPPFASCLDHGRRMGNHADMCDFHRIMHMLNIIHLEGGCSIEPTDLPVETRHLDIYLAACRLTDKPWKPLSVGVDRARDALEMARIALDEDEASMAADPVFFVNTNTNTPLVLDADIARGVLELARAGQVICITPFAMAGAMAPTTVAGALALQNAETLAGCALVQAARPGCPFVYGSFVCNADMRSGAPAFGNPEYALGAQASGQMARRYGLPWRSSNVTSSKAPDAQAAYESQMAIWGAVTGHVSVLNQGAGWLEGGLVASFEKLIIDAEMLQIIAAWTEGIDCSYEAIGLNAVAEVGPGGHFFGAAHTLERYEHAFYQPLVSDWDNYENWVEAGSQDAAARANRIWKDLLAAYTEPELDPGRAEALEAYVQRRKSEIMQSGLK